MKRFLLLFLLLTLPLVVMAEKKLKTQAPDSYFQNIDSSWLNTASTQLPEQTAVDTAFLNPEYNPFLTLNQDANVSVSFINEGAGYRNSLGWFSFNEDSFSGLSKSDIDTDNSGTVSFGEINQVEGVEAGWLFSNISADGSGGDLITGDTVTVGEGPFSAGSSVSFFLAQNAWSGDDSVSSSVLTNRQIFYGLDFLNPEAESTSTFANSTENSRHVAMLFADDNREQVIMGFEDLNRENRFKNDFFYRSDEDFNDAVFIIQSDPAGAFGNSNIATAPAPLLGGGLSGALLLACLGWMSQRSKS